jgi:D-alanine-D-alanine ligase
MKRVGVIRGNLNNRTKASIENGSRVISCLSHPKLKDNYKPVDIFIDHGERWHLNGVEIKPEKIYGQIDVAVNTIYGDFGEDGKIQQILDDLQIPYVGSRPVASALSYDKNKTKQALSDFKIKMPHHMLFPAYFKDLDSSQNESKEEEQKKEYAINKARDVWAKLPPPWIVKPLTGGSSLGVSVCNSLDDLVKAFLEGVEGGVSLITEEYIKGQEGSIVSINNFRGQEIYSFPPVEIVLPKGKAFCDNDLKNGGQLKIICPGNFSPAFNKEIEKIAKQIHKELNLRHYSKIDFIANRNGVYVIEINTIPEFQEYSVLNKSLKSVGSEMVEFLSHSIEMAISSS